VRRDSRLAVGLLLAATLLARPAAADEQKRPFALLPVEGSLAQRLDVPRLVDELSRRLGRPVLAADALVAQLRESTVAAGATQSAHALAQQAKSALLQMKGARAVRLAGKALRLLEPTGGWIHALHLKGRLHLAQAQGYMLPPVDLSAARASLVAGQRAVATLRRDDLPPRLRRLVRVSFDEKRRTHPPSAEHLEHVMTLAKVQGLAWIALHPGRKGKLLAEVFVFEPGRKAPLKVKTHQLSAAQAPLLLAQTIAQEVSRLPQLVPRTEPSSTWVAVPWHKKWWVWALAGAAVGMIAGAVVIINAEESSDNGLTIRFEFN